MSSINSLPILRSICDFGILYLSPEGEVTKMKLSDLASIAPTNVFFALTFFSNILSRFKFSCDIYAQHLQKSRIYVLINNVMLLSHRNELPYMGCFALGLEGVITP